MTATESHVGQDISVG